jgi:hypothetical protein
MFSKVQSQSVAKVDSTSTKGSRECNGSSGVLHNNRSLNKIYPSSEVNNSIKRQILTENPQEINNEIFANQQKSANNLLTLFGHPELCRRMLSRHANDATFYAKLQERQSFEWVNASGVRRFGRVAWHWFDSFTGNELDDEYCNETDAYDSVRIIS